MEGKLSSELAKLREDVKSESDRLEKLKLNVQGIEEKKAHEESSLKEIYAELDARKEDLQEIER